MTRDQHIGHAWPPFEVLIERGAAIAFARGLDETDPVYLDEAAARAAGLRGIAVLPTYPIAISTDRVDLIYDMLQRLQVDPAKILHASQRFVHHRPMCVGDRLVGTKRIAGIADRKNGALTFIDTVVEYRDMEGRPVCEDHCSLVARNT
jgi:acyl dehydratase